LPYDLQCTVFILSKYLSEASFQWESAIHIYDIADPLCAKT